MGLAKRVRIAQSFARFVLRQLHAGQLHGGNLGGGGENWSLLWLWQLTTPLLTGPVKIDVYVSYDFSLFLALRLVAS